MEVKDPEGITTSYSYNLAGKGRKRDIRINLLNDSSINTHYIEYKYDYNRLLGIFLPDLPSGDPNPSNVQYQYGLSTAGNNAGKIVTKADGSGDTVYKYGRMGEVISELRIIREAHIPEMYFKTYFNYDSWNRLTKIKYPDEELVSYHYDKGGNLKSVDNNYGETLIENSNYDNYEQRLKISYGNGTSQHYAYSAQNRRLDRYYLMNNANQMMLHNTYKYDQFSNISMIQNQADPLANGMGGAFQFNLNYDTLNRLIGTETGQVIIREKEGQIPITSFTPFTYNLVMEYNNVGGITRKHQHHERDQNVVHENTYENRYDYVQNTHKVERVVDQSSGNAEYFDYDFNGNTVNHNDSNGVKRMFWDEQDRLRAFYNDNTGTYQYYTYDDQGERVIKYGLEIPTQLYQNGVPIKIDELKLFEYKLYPNPYITVSSTGQYTKHYFEGSKRFASRLMDGAVRFEDPAVLYTNRSEEDKPAAKPADVKSDFEKYLEKSGLDNGVSVELRERNWSPDLYYLHGDHLGTATFVTNSQSQATQFFLNLPFGETMIEQMDGSYDNPFKFNAKELDEDTGLYYYGARYYNPRLSIWYGVDPLAVYNPVMETEFYGDGQHNTGVYYWGNLNPYIYTYQNPIVYIDPNGKQTKITDNNGVKNIHLTTKIVNNSSVKIEDATLIKRMEGNVNKILKSNGLGNSVKFTMSLDEKSTIPIYLENVMDAQSNITTDADGTVKGTFSQTNGWARLGNLDVNQIHMSLKEQTLSDGKVIQKSRSKSDIGRTFTHEYFHTLGLSHPWDSSAPSDLNGPKVTDKTVKNNIQNSHENPVNTRRSSDGTKMTEGQKTQIKNLKNK